MSQPPNQPYPAQPNPGQPHPGQPHPDQPSGEQPWSSPPGSGQPGYPGQPYQGQPNPDVPASVPPQPGYPQQPSSAPPPSYPQPEYAQPGYPQPGYQPGFPQPGFPQSGFPQSGYPQPGYPQQGGYPQPGPPMPGYPAPRKKSRALPITLVSIALVLVLCVGGGTAIYLAGRNTAQSLSDAIASAAPTPGTTTTAPRATITIVEPRTLGGRPKLTDPKFADRVDRLKTLALLSNATQSVGAIYGTPAKRDLVLVLAANSAVSDPKQEVDEAFSGAAFDNLSLLGVASIPPGPLGGAAKCAKGSDDGVQLSICAWADEGSSGLVIWYFTALSKAKDEFVKIRSQIERKSN